MRSQRVINFDKADYVNFIPQTDAEEIARKINYRHEKKLEAQLRCLEQEERYSASILNKKFAAMNKEVERLYRRKESCVSYISIGKDGKLCIQLNRTKLVPGNSDRYLRPTMMSSSPNNRTFHKDGRQVLNVANLRRNRRRCISCTVSPIKPERSGRENKFRSELQSDYELPPAIKIKPDVKSNSRNPACISKSISNQHATINYYKDLQREEKSESEILKKRKDIGYLSENGLRLTKDVSKPTTVATIREEKDISFKVTVPNVETADNKNASHITAKQVTSVNNVSKQEIPLEDEKSSINNVATSHTPAVIVTSRSDNTEENNCITNSHTSQGSKEITSHPKETNSLNGKQTRLQGGTRDNVTNIAPAQLPPVERVALRVRPSSAVDRKAYMMAGKQRPHSTEGRNGK